MANHNDAQLHQLYLELADVQAGNGRGTEAADHYALAMYYARRMGDSEKVALCKRRILECQPAHIAGHENSAPLFFAQLLIRYPAEEAAQTLQLIKRAGLAPDPSPIPTLARASAAGFVEEGRALEDFEKKVLNDIGWMKPPAREPEWVSEPAPPAAATSPMTPTPAPEFESHHVFESKNRIASGDRAVTDYLPPERLFPKDRRAWSEVGFWGSMLNSAAVAAVIIGIGAIGFLSRELYPDLARMDPKGFVELVKQTGPETLPSMVKWPMRMPEVQITLEVDAKPRDFDEPTRIGMKPDPKHR